MQRIKEISIKELQEMNCDNFSKKANTPRGIETVSKSNIKVGDKVVLNNYFTLVIE